MRSTTLRYIVKCTASPKDYGTVLYTIIGSRLRENRTSVYANVYDSLAGYYRTPQAVAIRRISA